VAEAISEPTLAIDAYVELPDLTLDLVTEINRLAPFGPGNPPLTLAVRDLRLVSHAAIGRTKEHLRLTVEDQRENTQTVFWWQGADQPLPRGIFDLALTVRSSDYRGMAEVQAEWIDAHQQEPYAIEIEPAPTFEIQDYREACDPEAILRGLVTHGDVQVWAEGLAPAPTEARTRLELDPCQRLAVWSTPPGQRQWQAVLSSVQPDEIYLFAKNPGMDERRAFLHDLGSLVNYALRNLRGRLELERAAAKLGHRAGTIARGLEHLGATGALSIVERGEETWQIEAATGEPDLKQVDAAKAKLDEHLEETSAYRQYFQTALPSDLVR
jgi:hypothetical protein